MKCVLLNKKNMTLRQRLLKIVYPLFMKAANTKAKAVVNERRIDPPVSFYSLNTILNDGQQLHFESLREKKVLLVNTASDCGYTAQYADLQKLHEQFKNQLVIIGFPANDFKEQEKADDEAIAEFCQVNYGVTFPLAKKSVVIKDAAQNSVFNWLTDAAKNGWNEKQPSWNFSKYLVDEKGMLTHIFDPAISPLDKEVLDAIEKINPLSP